MYIRYCHAQTNHCDQAPAILSTLELAVRLFWPIKTKTATRGNGLALYCKKTQYEPVTSIGVHKGKSKCKHATIGNCQLRVKNQNNHN